LTSETPIPLKKKTLAHHAGIASPRTRAFSRVSPVYVAQRDSGMKVLFDHSFPFFLAHGGFQTQIEQSKAALEAVGVEVEFLRWWDDAQRGDIIHYFGRPVGAYVDLARKKGIKFVLAELLTGLGSRRTPAEDSESRPYQRQDTVSHRVYRATRLGLLSDGRRLYRPDSLGKTTYDRDVLRSPRQGSLRAQRGGTGLFPKSSASAPAMAGLHRDHYAT